MPVPNDIGTPGVARATTAAPGPLLPCLKERKWQGREHAVCRALWEQEASSYMPWLAVGYDHPHSFEFISNPRVAEMQTTEQALEADAIRNLLSRPAKWESVDVDVNNGKRLKMLLCGEDFFAAEHILDSAFMQQAQRKLGARGLLVGIPRRGLMLATSIDQDEEMVSAFGAVVAGQFSRGETAVISPMLFALRDGAIVGIIEAVAEAIVPDGEPQGDPDTEDDENDPNAPYITAMVVRNDSGREDVHLLAGGQDGVRLGKGIEAAFMELLKQHATQKEFSGHIRIVVLGMTPPAARKTIPSLLQHLRGLCAELSHGAERFQVSLTYQRDSLGGTADAAPVAAPAKPAASPAVPAEMFSWWKKAPSWLRVVVLLIVGFVLLNRVLTEMVISWLP